MLAKQGKLTEAPTEFEKAIALKSRFTEAHNNLGIALARQGQLTNAVEQFTKAIEFNPGFAEAHNNLAIALLSDGEQDQGAMAESELKTAIALNPHYADAENNLGTFYMLQGKEVDGERLFRQSMQSDPRFLKAFLSLSGVMIRQSRFSEADAVLRQALAIDPTNKQALALHDQMERRLNP